MAKYEIVGPDGKILGTASELDIAKRLANQASKTSGLKIKVRDTSKSNVQQRNAEVLRQIKGMRGGGAGGMFGFKNR